MRKRKENNKKDPSLLPKLSHFPCTWFLCESPEVKKCGWCLGCCFFLFGLLFFLFFLFILSCFRHLRARKICCIFHLEIALILHHSLFVVFFLLSLWKNWIKPKTTKSRREKNQKRERENIKIYREDIKEKHKKNIVPLEKWSELIWVTRFKFYLFFLIYFFRLFSNFFWFLSLFLLLHLQNCFFFSFSRAKIYNEEIISFCSSSSSLPWNTQRRKW